MSLETGLITTCIIHRSGLYRYELRIVLNYIQGVKTFVEQVVIKLFTLINEPKRFWYNYFKYT